MYSKLQVWCVWCRGWAQHHRSCTGGWRMVLVWPADQPKTLIWPVGWNNFDTPVIMCLLLHWQLWSGEAGRVLWYMTSLLFCAAVECADENAGNLKKNLSLDHHCTLGTPWRWPLWLGLYLPAEEQALMYSAVAYKAIIKKKKEKGYPAEYIPDLKQEWGKDDNFHCQSKGHCCWIPGKGASPVYYQ